MKEKLLELMKSEGLKSGQFAELLEVNPAGISHILAGRNKPGFDLLQKILRRFPQVNPDWLLLDSPQMYRNDTFARPGSDPKLHTVARPDDLFGGALGEGPGQTTAENRSATNPASREKSVMQNGASGSEIQTTGKPAVKRIIVLYEDRTFESFTPADYSTH